MDGFVGSQTTEKINPSSVNKNMEALDFMEKFQILIDSILVEKPQENLLLFLKLNFDEKQVCSQILPFRQSAVSEPFCHLSVTAISNLAECEIDKVNLKDLIHVLSCTECRDQFRQAAHLTSLTHSEGTEEVPPEWTKNVLQIFTRRKSI